jgi:hypothetical protein
MAQRRSRFKRCQKLVCATCLSRQQGRPAARTSRHEWRARAPAERLSVRRARRARRWSPGCRGRSAPAGAGVKVTCRPAPCSIRAVAVVEHAVSAVPWIWKCPLRRRLAGARYARLGVTIRRCWGQQAGSTSGDSNGVQHSAPGFATSRASRRARFVSFRARPAAFWIHRDAWSRSRTPRSITRTPASAAWAGSRPPHRQRGTRRRLRASVSADSGTMVQAPQPRSAAAARRAGLASRNIAAVRRDRGGAK